MSFRDLARYDYLLKSLEVINISDSNLEQKEIQHEQEFKVITLKLSPY